MGCEWPCKSGLLDHCFDSYSGCSSLSSRMVTLPIAIKKKALIHIFGYTAVKQIRRWNHMKPQNDRHSRLMIFRLESPLGISPNRLQGRYPAGCRLSPPDRAGQRRTGPLLSRWTKWVVHRLTVRCGKSTICRLFTWGNYRSSTSMLAYNRYHLHPFTVTKQSMVIFSSKHEDVTSHFFSWWPAQRWVASSAISTICKEERFTVITLESFQGTIPWGLVDGGFGHCGWTSHPAPVEKNMVTIMKHGFNFENHPT